ncbi:hypothetical protein GWK47_028707 [Chionoecetes opilio]|uniref:Uncharacterized protein n=1 Tax=Chionoecetes opilio TaxID=41210 RepID=A0A8J4YSY7_CHIOP|nr:hypothetical protein GWK47_028707 [Chionoecetes opilio]
MKALCASQHLVQPYKTVQCGTPSIRLAANIDAPYDTNMQRKRSLIHVLARLDETMKLRVVSEQTVGAFAGFQASVQPSVVKTPMHLKDVVQLQDLTPGDTDSGESDSYDEDEDNDIDECITLSGLTIDASSSKTNKREHCLRVDTVFIMLSTSCVACTTSRTLATTCSGGSEVAADRKVAESTTNATVQVLFLIVSRLVKRH